MKATSHPGIRRASWSLTRALLVFFPSACGDAATVIDLPPPGDSAQSVCFEAASNWEDTDFEITLALADGASTHRGWVLGRAPGNSSNQVFRLDDRGEIETVWAWTLGGDRVFHGIAPGVRDGTALVDSSDGGERRLFLFDANGGANLLVASTPSFETLYTDAAVSGDFTVQYAANADRTLLMLGPTTAPDLGLVFLLLELDSNLDVDDAWTVFYDPGITAAPFEMTAMVEGRPLALPSLPLTVFPYARVLKESDPAVVAPLTVAALWIGRIRGDRGTVEIVDPVVIEAGYSQGIATTTPDVVDAAADPTTTWYLYDDTQASGDALLIAIDDVRDVAVLAQLDDVGVSGMRLLQLADGVALLRHVVGDDTLEVTKLSRDYDPVEGAFTLSGTTTELDVSRTGAVAVTGIRTAGVGHVLVDYADGRSRMQGIRCVPSATPARLPHVRSTRVTRIRSPGADPS